MQNYLLTLAYDGTNYCGFQVQPNGRSVAQTFQDGLEAVLHSRPDIKGCSRTDAGVHALGFALNFHAETRIPPEKLPLAINQHLPPDIRAHSTRIQRRLVRCSGWQYCKTSDARPRSQNRLSFTMPGRCISKERHQQQR